MAGETPQNGTTTTMTTTTTIVVYTSGAASIRAACQAGWSRLSLDLSDWTAEERDSLASAIVDTDRGPKLATRNHDVMRSARHCTADGLTDGCLAIDLAPPTVYQLRDLVRADVEDRRAKRAAREAMEAEIRAAKADRDAQRAATIEALRTAPVEALIARKWNSDEVAELCPPERVDEARKEIARRKHAAEEASAAAEAERVASLAATLADIAPALLPRFNAGVLPDRELKDALALLLVPALDAVGPEIPPHDRQRSAKACKDMTELQFTAWTTLNAATAALVLPGGAVAVPHMERSRGYDVYDPHHEDADPDGDVFVACERVMITITAEILGVEVSAERWI